MATHTIFPSILPDGEADTTESGAICGEEQSDGTICERDPDECPYHG